MKAFVIALVVTVVLSACGGGDSGTSTTETTATDAQGQTMERLLLTRSDLPGEWTVNPPVELNDESTATSTAINNCTGLEPDASILDRYHASELFTSGETSVTSTAKLFKSEELARRAVGGLLAQRNWNCIGDAVIEDIKQRELGAELSVKISLITGLTLGQDDIALRYEVFDNINRSTGLWVATIGTRRGSYVTAFTVQSTEAAPATDLQRRLFISLKAKLTSTL